MTSPFTYAGDPDLPGWHRWQSRDATRCNLRGPIVQDDTPTIASVAGTPRKSTPPA